MTELTTSLMAIDGRLAQVQRQVETLERLIGSARAGKEHTELDRELCLATRKVLWYTVRASLHCQLVTLRDLYYRRIRSALEAAREMADDPDYIERIAERGSQLEDFMEAGKLKLNKYARERILVEFPEDAERMLRLLDGQEVAA
jgi:hypothetical protein